MMNIKTKKFICIISSVSAVIYTLWYMHYATPYKNSGALSKIGLTHHIEFIIWGVITFFALAFNIITAYKNHTKTKVYIPLLITSGVGMMLTLAFDFDFDKKADYYFHCAGSLAFSVVMGITIFILFAVNYKKERIFKAFSIITAAILIIDLICLLIFKETALIEVLPIFAGYILLNITNLRSERIEITR